MADLRTGQRVVSTRKIGYNNRIDAGWVGTVTQGTSWTSSFAKVRFDKDPDEIDCPNDSIRPA